MRKRSIMFVVMTFMLIIQVQGLYGQTRVACVGNSITAGYGTSNGSTKAWPIQFGGLMGSGYYVRNFGVSGTTMLKNGSSPYWNTQEFVDAKNFNPQILIIGLGTNDSWYGNWDSHKNEFYNDYADMISEFRQGGRNPEIYVCLPPPISDANQNANLVNEVIPYIQAISNNLGTKVIDFNGQLGQSGGLFPDGLHPNDQGAAVMAQLAFNAVTGGVANNLSGTYYLQNRNSGLYLDVEAGSTADGANILQWTGTNGINQRFTLNHLGNGVYSIISAASGKSLDVYGQSVSNNGNIIQWGYYGGSNQKFTLMPAGNGYYKIKILHSAMLLDVEGGSSQAGGNVLQWPDFNQTNAQWRLVSGSNARQADTGMEESSEEIAVYPNPVADYLTLSNVSADSRVTIYDLTGQRVLTHNITQVVTKQSIDLRKLEKGSYVVLIEGDQNRQFKILKQ